GPEDGLEAAAYGACGEREPAWSGGRDLGLSLLAQGRTAGSHRHGAAAEEDGYPAHRGRRQGLSRTGLRRRVEADERRRARAQVPGWHPAMLGRPRALRSARVRDRPEEA